MRTGGPLGSHILQRSKFSISMQAEKKLSDARTTLEQRDLEKHHQLDSFFLPDDVCVCTDQVVHDAATF